MATTEEIATTARLAAASRGIADEAEDALIARHVYLDPQRPNWGEARMVESGTNVWALVAYRDANNVGLAEIANAYHLTHEAVDAAFAYYRRHKCEING